ncbi:MAG TPA: hypothetical protein VF268_16720 [Gammaproteobacteria bacterium]
MALHPHVEEFYREWLRKSDQYSNEELSGCFNKAFSLFTLYNKLYAEATFILARRNEIKIDESRGFPDRKGAIEFAPRYIGYENLHLELFNSDDCSAALDNIIRPLKQHQFYIKLSMPYGERQPQKDEALLKKLESTVTKETGSGLDSCLGSTGSKLRNQPI